TSGLLSGLLRRVLIETQLDLQAVSHILDDPRLARLWTSPSIRRPGLDLHHYFVKQAWPDPLHRSLCVEKAGVVDLLHFLFHGGQAVTILLDLFGDLLLAAFIMGIRMNYHCSVIGAVQGDHGLAGPVRGGFAILGCRFV